MPLAHNDITMNTSNFCSRFWIARLLHTLPPRTSFQIWQKITHPSGCWLLSSFLRIRSANTICTRYISSCLRYYNCISKIIRQQNKKLPRSIDCLKPVKAFKLNQLFGLEGELLTRREWPKRQSAHSLHFLAGMLMYKPDAGGKAFLG